MSSDTSSDAVLEANARFYAAFEARDLDRLLELTEIFLSWRRRRQACVADAPLHMALMLSGLVDRQRRYLRRAGGDARATGGQPSFVGRIARHVFANMGRAIPVCELAAITALSPSRLRARFREAAGISLGLFIRRTRIHRACGLLHSTGRTVSEISEACGFESLYSFSRAFKQVIGRSPRDYRMRGPLA
jgi:AraC-like DNA-binding protein